MDGQMGECGVRCVRDAWCCEGEAWVADGKQGTSLRLDFLVVLLRPKAFNDSPDLGIFRVWYLLGSRIDIDLAPAGSFASVIDKDAF